MTLFMLFLSGDWVLCGSEPCFSLWFLSCPTSAGKVINCSGFLLCCSLSQPLPNKSSSSEAAWLWWEKRGLGHLKTALGCHSQTSFLFTGLTWLDESTSSPPPRLSTRERLVALIHLPRDWAQKLSCAQIQEAVHTSITHLFFPANQTCSAAEGLDPVNSHWVISIFTSGHSYLLRIKLSSRYGSAFCPLALPSSEAGELLDTAVKGISFGLSQTWVKIPATQLALWAWASYSTSLSLNFLICQMKMRRGDKN